MLGTIRLEPGEWYWIKQRADVGCKWQAAQYESGFFSWPNSERTVESPYMISGPIPKPSL